VWWANQGRSLTAYENDRDGGYLWARQARPNGRTYEHWTNVTLMAVGDATLHYVRGRIVALGSVRKTAVEGPRPRQDLDFYDQPGWKVEVEYFELENPIGRNDIPSEWCVPLSGPFRCNGKVKIGFVYGLSPRFATDLRDLFPSRWPSASPWGLADKA
jgi:hypothetical protein